MANAISLTVDRRRPSDLSGGVWTRPIVPDSPFHRRGRIEVEPGVAVRFIDDPMAGITLEPKDKFSNLGRDMANSDRFRDLVRSELFAGLRAAWWPGYVGKGTTWIGTVGGMKVSSMSRCCLKSRLLNGNSRVPPWSSCKSADEVIMTTPVAEASPAMEPALRRALMRANPSYFGWTVEQQERYRLTIPDDHAFLIQRQLFKELFGIEIRSKDDAEQAYYRFRDERIMEMADAFPASHGLNVDWDVRHL